MIQLEKNLSTLRIDTLEWYSSSDQSKEVVMEKYNRTKKEGYDVHRSENPMRMNKDQDWTFPKKVEKEKRPDRKEISRRNSHESLSSDTSEDDIMSNYEDNEDDINRHGKSIDQEKRSDPTREILLQEKRNLEKVLEIKSNTINTLMEKFNEVKETLIKKDKEMKILQNNLIEIKNRK